MIGTEANLKFPTKVKVMGQASPELLYTSIKDAYEAYDLASDFVSTTPNKESKLAAVELMLISKYTIYKLGNIANGAVATNLLTRTQYFAEWVDANREKIPEVIREEVIGQYCKGYRQLFVKRTKKDTRLTAGAAQPV